MAKKGIFSKAVDAVSDIFGGSGGPGGGPINLKGYENYNTQSFDNTLDTDSNNLGRQNYNVNLYQTALEALSNFKFTMDDEFKKITNLSADNITTNVNLVPINLSDNVASIITSMDRNIRIIDNNVNVLRRDIVNIKRLNSYNTTLLQKNNEILSNIRTIFYRQMYSDTENRMESIRQEARMDTQKLNLFESNLMKMMNDMNSMKSNIQTIADEVTALKNNSGGIDIDLAKKAKGRPGISGGIGGATAGATSKVIGSAAGVIGGGAIAAGIEYYLGSGGINEAINTGALSASGAIAGAAVGSVVPGIGTGIGAFIGGVALPFFASDPINKQQLEIKLSSISILLDKLEKNSKEGINSRNIFNQTISEIDSLRNSYRNNKLPDEYEKELVDLEQRLNYINQTYNIDGAVHRFKPAEKSNKEISSNRVDTAFGMFSSTQQQALQQAAAEESKRKIELFEKLKQGENFAGFADNSRYVISVPKGTIELVAKNIIGLDDIIGQKVKSELNDLGSPSGTGAPSPSSAGALSPSGAGASSSPGNIPSPSKEKDKSSTDTSSSGGTGGVNKDAINKTFAGTPLENKADAIIAAAKKHNIDPALFAAVIAHETGKGTSSALRNKNNPGGIMDPKTNLKQTMRFNDLEEGLDYSAHILKRNYDRASGNLERLRDRYAPIGASNDPNNLNRHWLGGVNKFKESFTGPKESQTETTVKPLEKDIIKPGIPSIGEQGALISPNVDIDYKGRSDIEYGREATKNMVDPEAVVFHHTGKTAPVQSFVDYQHRGTAQGQHIGYHFYIDRDGKITQGAPLSKRTNHIKGASSPERAGGVDSGLNNNNTIGISFVGSTNRKGEEDVTEEQKAAGLRLLKELKKKYSTIDLNRTYGHGELQPADRSSVEVSIAREIRKKATEIDAEIEEEKSKTFAPNKDGEVEQSRRLDKAGLSERLDKPVDKPSLSERLINGNIQSRLNDATKIDGTRGISPRSGMMSPITGTFIGGPKSYYGAERRARGGGIRPHSGVDWRAPDGSSVTAMTGGKVVHAGYQSGYGYTVDVETPSGDVFRYATHGQDYGWKVGDTVKQGDQIGTIGSGHLHFEVIKGDFYKNQQKIQSDTFVSTSGQKGTVNPEEYFKELGVDLNRRSPVKGGELLPSNRPDPFLGRYEPETDKPLVSPRKSDEPVKRLPLPKYPKDDVEAPPKPIPSTTRSIEPSPTDASSKTIPSSGSTSLGGSSGGGGGSIRVASQIDISNFHDEINSLRDIARNITEGNEPSKKSNDSGYQKNDYNYQKNNQPATAFA